MDLQKVLNSETQKLIESGTIEDMVKKNLEKCVSDLVAEQFRYGSPIKKSLEKALEGALSIDLSEVSLSSMFTFVADHAKSELSKVISDEAKSKYIDEVNSILKPLPDEMTIESFVEQIIQFWLEDDCDKSDWEEDATIEIEEHFWGGQSLKVYVNEKPRYGTTSKAKDVEIYLGDNKDGYNTVKISHRNSYNPTCLHDEEALIFKAYTQQVKITGVSDFDSCDIDTSVKSDEYY